MSRLNHLPWPGLQGEPWRSRPSTRKAVAAKKMEKIMALLARKGRGTASIRSLAHAPFPAGKGASPLTP